ncbi:MAG TPA: class I SAM-dependent methyltransferase [Vicinamibacterales bacterium]|nr:class I SAM-dependent methyltransferase [Vicinamibacterales bacterium]
MSLSPYQSPRLAAGYAFSRPPVHRHVIDLVREHLRPDAHADRALDIGCGAGLSTAALQPLSSWTVGLEPIGVMLTHSREVAPDARFVIAAAERLPFTDDVFDLVAAAGSVNYADRAMLLSEAARVMSRGALFLIYDYSPGRRARNTDALAQWFREFQAQFPEASGYELDLRTLEYAGAGLRLEAYVESEVAMPMSLEAYLAYVLTETRVERTIAGGMAESAATAWCRGTLQHVFAHGALEVVFETCVAYVRHA